MKPVFIALLLLLYSCTATHQNLMANMPKGQGRCTGPKDAKVEILEFSDFECFFCMMSQSRIKRLLQDFNGKVRVCFQYYPLSMHKHAKDAAIAACVASEQGRFWEYHDLLFGSAFEWASLDRDSALKKFAQLASLIDLNEANFLNLLHNPPQHCLREIEEDIALGKRMGVRGTPTFFINGTKLVGAQPYEKFKAVVESALANKNSN